MTIKTAAEFQQSSTDRGGSAPMGPLQSVEFTSNTSGDFLAVIRPSRGRRFVSRAVIVAFVGVLSVVLMQFQLWQASNGPTPAGRGLAPMIHFIQVADLLIVEGLAAYLLTSRWTLRLDSLSLEISHAILGRTVSRRSFQNADIRNLRYAHWETQGKNCTIGQSGIKFEVGTRTQSFGKSLADSDGNDLLTRMRERYNFPISEAESPIHVS